MSYLTLSNKKKLQKITHISGGGNLPGSLNCRPIHIRPLQVEAEQTDGSKGKFITQVTYFQFFFFFLAVQTRV